MTRLRLIDRWKNTSASTYSSLALLFSFVVLLSAWGAMALMLQWQWNETLAAEMRQNTNNARALKEHTLRILGTVDQSMVRVQEAAAAGTLTGELLVRTANETGMVPQILTQMSFVDTNGIFIASNLDPTGARSKNVNLMDREHIRVHLRPEQELLPGMMSDGLFISKSLVGKVSGVRTIQLSRKLLDSRGRVIGVVVASLNQAHFIDVYRGVELGREGVVALVGLDGTIRARVIGGAAHETTNPLPRTVVELLNSHASGAGRSISSDGLPRIIGYSRVGDYDLAILCGTSENEAFAPWRTTRNFVLLLTLVLSLATAAFMAAFLTSIRKLTRSHEALARSQAQALRANQAKSEFLTAMSHELRTPLTGIRGFAELMEMRSQEPLIREQSQLIRQGAEHLNALLTEILDLAKIEAGAMPTYPEPVLLDDLLREVIELFRVSAVAKSLKLDFYLHAAAAQPLVTDRLKLKQILNNLLSNAIKFTSDGGVRVDVEIDAQGQQMLFHVTDTGPGIALELQEQIFEKFSQGGARISYEHGGTGLGLSLSRALAALLGGTLSVQSRLGEGARFTLALPYPEK